MKMGQIGEQGLNLSESWHRGHSYTYNTPFCSKSSAKDLLHSIFELAFGRTSPATRFAPGQSRDPVYDLGRPEGRPMRMRDATPSAHGIAAFSAWIRA